MKRQIRLSLSLAQYLELAGVANERGMDPPDYVYELILKDLRLHRTEAEQLTLW